MAQENLFAILGDQETDDVSKLIGSLKVEEPLKPSAAALEKKKEQKPKQKFQMDPHEMRAKPIILPRHVRRSFLVLRKEKKDEQKPQENSQAKEPGKQEAQIMAAAATNCNGQQSSSDNGEKDKNQGKNHPDSNHGNGNHQGQRYYRVGNGYQGHYRNSYSYGVVDGYQGNYSRSDSYQVNNNNNNGGYRGGRGGRGRGFQQRRFYENNGSGKEGQAVAYGNNYQHQQEFYYGKDQGQQCYGGYRGKGPRGYYRRDGSKYYKNGINNGDKKSDQGGSSNNGENKNVNFAVVTEEGQEAAVSNGGDSKEGNGDNKGDKKSKMMKSKSKGVQDKFVNKAEENEKVDGEKKLMTLKEYEESLVEKIKFLEALKKDWGRKVLTDEEFGSMKIIGKKKEEKKSELKKKDHSHSFNEVKVHKSMSITEFLKPDGNRSYYGQRPYGRGNNWQGTYGIGNEQRNYGSQEGPRPFYGGGGRGGYGGYRSYHGGRGGRGRGGDYDPHIEDLSQFPVLGKHGSA